MISFHSLYPMKRLSLASLGLSICLLSTLTGCSGMNGCAGDGDPFPNKDKIQSAIQVRITESGFDTIGQTVTPIIKDALPPELNSCLPGDSGTASFIEWRYCNMQTCSNGETGCDINISVGDVILTGVEPNVVRASVVLDQLALRFDVGADPIVDCDIAIDGPNVPVNLDISLRTPEPQRNLSIVVGDASYELSDITIRLEGNDGILSPLCEILDGAFNLPFIRDVVLDLLGGVIDNVLIFGLQSVINDFVCLPCEGEEDPICTSQGGTCVLGSCIREDLTCVNRPLGLEGETDLGDFVSSVAPNLEAPLSYFLNPGSYAEVKESGLSLGVISGTGAELNRCVPPAIPPNIEEPPRISAIEANLTPDGQEYDLGLAISQTMIDQALWSIYTSGVACLGITSETVAQLNSNTLQILLPNLGKLTRGSAPIAISLAPQVPPQAIIGENRLGEPDPNGERALEDPLLTIDWPDLWLDFHTFMENRWTRIFSLKVHLILPLGVTFDPSGGVIPLLGDLNAALTDLEVSNDQILIDDTSRITMLLPTLTGPLIGTALSSLSDPIALPEIFGFALAPQEGSVRGMSEQEEDFIVLFADLVQVPPSEMAGEMDGQMGDAMMEGKRDERIQSLSMSDHLKERVLTLKEGQIKPYTTAQSFPTSTPAFTQHLADTRASIIETHTPPLEGCFQGKDHPSITLELSTPNGSLNKDFPKELNLYEYSWRVDQMGWRPFTTSTKLKITDPAFLLPGAHLIEVRSRRVGDIFSLDPSPVELSVTLYDLPPTEDSGPVSPRSIIGRADPHLEELATSTGCACDTLQNDRKDRGKDMILWFIMIMIFVSLRPRAALYSINLSIAKKSLRTHLRRLLFLSLFLNLGLYACDDETKPRKDPTECSEDQCGDNQICIEGACSTLTCLEDTSCTDLGCEGDELAVCGMTGQCECPSAPLCPEGCADNEYCCFQSNECQQAPSPCEGMEELLSCPAGFELGASMRGVVNPQSCELEGEVCECIESTPLTIKSLGRYSDLAYDPVRGIGWVSAYDEDHGDLVVGRVSQDERILWYWVDGVPSGAPTVAAPSGPRSGVDEPGDDVGQHTSLIIGDDGNVHVAYHSVIEKRLKYALGIADQTGSITWSVISLDAGGTLGEDPSDRNADEGAGWWTDIILDSLNRPVIIYRALESNEGGGVHPKSSVRVLSASRALPRTSNDWGQPNVLHEIVPDDALMSLGYPEGTGLFNSITKTPTGLAAAWYDRSEGNLMMASSEGDQFNPAEIVAGWGHESRRGDFGANANLIADEGGALHYCYQDGATDSLRYLSPDLERDEWVDDGVRLAVGGRERSLHVVGEDCMLSFDERGRVLITYQDATGHELIVARRDASGSWLRVTVRGPNQGESQASCGFYARGISVGDDLLLSHYVYENQLDPPREYLEVLKVPSP